MAGMATAVDTGEASHEGPRRLGHRPDAPVPASTYRLQLNADFTFADATARLDYIASLGATHLYLSPILRAAPGSTHFYDVVDHAHVSPVLGGEDGLRALAAAAHTRGLGLIADVVPNHMAVPTPAYHNRALWSVLAEGEDSPFAHWFDVDWASGDPVLMPVLGQRIGTVLAAGELTLDRLTVPGFEDAGEVPVLRYYDHVFPVRPGTESLPLDSLVTQQHYRLAYWRVANEELNYRRFFDVGSLVALRLEDPEVFDATHRLIVSLVKDGTLDGLRIDHPDGLADPAGYLARLADATNGAWVVVEKILEDEERLPQSWKAAGTTGYDAAWRVGALLRDPAGSAPLAGTLYRLAGDAMGALPGIVDEAKRQIVKESLSSEVHRLATIAHDICTADVRLRDHTWRALYDCLRTILVTFGRYRAYVVPGVAPQPDSLEAIDQAAERARALLDPERHETLDVVVDLLKGVEVGSAGRTFEAARAELVTRFQQACGAVMAKGVEDTAYYRWTHLMALTEVGSPAARFALPPASFHAWAAEQQATYPHSMTGLSTHDSKRSEDVRATLGVLSEYGQAWDEVVGLLRAAAEPYRPPELDGRMENLWWQTLAGTYGDDGPMAWERLSAYLVKAMREAKTYTTWTAVNERYEHAVLGFADLTRHDRAVEEILATWHQDTAGPTSRHDARHEAPATHHSRRRRRLPGHRVPGAGARGPRQPAPRGLRRARRDPRPPRRGRQPPHARRGEALGHRVRPARPPRPPRRVRRRGVRIPAARVLVRPRRRLRTNGRGQPPGRHRRDAGRPRTGTPGRMGRRDGSIAGRATARGQARPDQVARRAHRRGPRRRSGLARRHPRDLPRRPPRARVAVQIEVWAPAAQSVVVHVGPRAERDSYEFAARKALDRPGWWLGPAVAPGVDYAFVLDGKGPFPDPRSAAQPHGVHAASRTFDASAFAWADEAWRGRDARGAVFYELHVGTFTPEGTLDAAAARVDYLAGIGIEMVELMPICPFPGRYGWGYDGVAPFAVHEAYGGPEALQRFVDAAHAAGLGVCLDVVYNHLGPSGNYLAKFGPYFTDAYETPWGWAVNLDQDGSVEVRRYLVDNALRWFADFHVDALRLDAVHELHDHSGRHFLAQLSDEVADLADRLNRPLSLVAESDLNDDAMVTPTRDGGLGMAAQWDDDVHHALHAYLTGERQGYYVDFGSAECLDAVYRNAFWHNGTYSPFRGKEWGRPVAPGRDRRAFVVCAANHDQVGNRALGDRPSSHLSPGAQAAALAFVMLGPFTPMVFMGEEYGETRPWMYFTDFEDPDLAEAVRHGRTEEFSGHGWEEVYGGPVDVPNPQDPATARASILDPDAAVGSPHDELRAWFAALVAARSLTLRRGAWDRHPAGVEESAPRILTLRGPVIVHANLSGASAEVPAATPLAVFGRLETQGSRTILAPDSLVLVDASKG